MVAPGSYAVTITVAGTDVTNNVPYNSMTIEDYARQVGRFRFTLEDPAITPARQDEVVVEHATLGTVFRGYIVELTDRKYDNGVVSHYDIECGDTKILLQKTNIPYAELSGTDADILSGLLSNAYPDLSTEFDFSSGVNSFADNLDFTANNENLLDALEKLSDLSGGANYKFDDVAATDPYIEDFDENENDPPITITTGAGGTMLEGTQAGGVGGSTCYGSKEDADVGDSIGIEFDFGETLSVTSVEFAYVIDWNGTAFNLDFDVKILDDSLATVDTKTVAFTGEGGWTQVVSDDDGIYPVETSKIRFVMTYNSATTDPGDVRMLFDNLTVNFSSDNQTQLDWSNTPDSAPFDLDIGNGDEFASDINLDIGDYDDFNSITVVGGSKARTIDWTYENDGYEERINLEAPVDDIRVYENTNTDASPTWSELTVGTYGSDDLTSEGGASDVLYAADNAWLLFDSVVANLGRSIRVTGTINQPIRVRVENVADGERTYATSYTDESISSEGQAVSIANALLAKQNAVRRVTFNTYEPGLRAGQEMSITDSARGLSETVIIQRVRTSWEGSNHARFQVECGQEDATNAASIIANNDKRSRENALPPATTVTTAETYTDDSGTIMTDDSGEILYEVV